MKYFFGKKVIGMKTAIAVQVVACCFCQVVASSVTMLPKFYIIKLGTVTSVSDLTSNKTNTTTSNSET
jgi:hypothetical protein